jgi:hypothetical protein
MTRTPHFLTFARALALVSAAAAPGCYQAHERATDSGPTPDAGPVADARFDCTSCACGGTTVTCESLGHNECCFRTGPIPPPDLAAA